MLRRNDHRGQPKPIIWTYPIFCDSGILQPFSPTAKGFVMQTSEMPEQPDSRVSVREVFAIDSNLQVPAFAERSDMVPEVDQGYHFNAEATLAILAGFTHNRRVMLQGLHGTGKSTHIEQVAARLNWPCMRVNLDGHISRLDLVGKDTIVIRKIAR